MEIKEQELQKLEQQVKELQEQINKIKIPNKRNIIDKLKEKPISHIMTSDNDETIVYKSSSCATAWKCIMNMLKEVLQSDYEFEEKCYFSPTYSYKSIGTTRFNPDKEKIVLENLEREVYHEIINMADELVSVYNKYYKMFHSSALVKFIDIPYSIEVKVGEDLNVVKQREKQKAKQKIEQSIAQGIDL